MVRDPRDVLVDVGDPHKVKIGDVLVIRPNCCHSSISGERVIWHQPARPLCVMFWRDADPLLKVMSMAN